MHRLFPVAVICSLGLIGCHESELVQRKAPVLDVSVMPRMTFIDIHSRLGDPSKTYPNGGDGWYRKTENNEFEVRVFYYADPSASRLHPEVRVKEVDFWPDKAQPWQQMLHEIAEIRDLCISGCHVDLQSDDFDKEIIACRDALGVTTQVDIPSEPASDEEPCMNLSFSSSRKKPQMDLATEEVASISIYLLRPQQALYMKHHKDLGIMKF